MATIIIKKETRKEAQALMSKVYDAEKDATFSNRRRNVVGSSLFAQLNADNSVEIRSAYYTESSLREMFE